MASLQARISRGKKYWSIVESRRVNGKPRTFILEYLGTATALLKRLHEPDSLSLKSYSHGDTHALLQAAEELDVINIINRHTPTNKLGTKQSRDGLCVGASFLLAAIGRACQPTSKMAWSNWCQGTSLEYSLRAQLKKLDSQHFWEQMNILSIEAISRIEEDLVKHLAQTYDIKPDCLFFDTTNFFTFIDSTNTRCNLPKRGKNKQKRNDLRQIGMALLVTRKEQFPLFHTVYEGNKADSNVFKDELTRMLKRLSVVIDDTSSITLVFDKGNNSKVNFAFLDSESCHYVASLVPSQFKSLLDEANQHFLTLDIKNKISPTYRLTKKIWGKERTCVITISTQLREGQLQGINQCLEKKYKILTELKQRLERPKPRTKLLKKELTAKLSLIIKGQFVEKILKYNLTVINSPYYSFDYYLDNESFEELKDNLLGRQIIVTNRDKWSNEDILRAYHGQCKVEYAFRNLKNPYHLAIRPQYHWTDQKIRVHFLICVIAYMLSIAVYTKVKRAINYEHNIQRLMDELRTVRLVCITKGKSSKVSFEIENIPDDLKSMCKILNISNENIRSNLAAQLPVTTQ